MIDRITFDEEVDFFEVDVSGVHGDARAHVRCAHQAEAYVGVERVGVGQTLARVLRVHDVQLARLVHDYFLQT